MRLIDADALIEVLKDSIDNYGDVTGTWASMMPDICAIVREMPEAGENDKRGRWIKGFYPGSLAPGHDTCSYCGYAHMYGRDHAYCPNCGAGMDGENEGDQRTI